MDTTCYKQCLNRGNYPFEFAFFVREGARRSPGANLVEIFTPPRGPVYAKTATINDAYFFAGINKKKCEANIIDKLQSVKP